VDPDRNPRRANPCGDDAVTPLTSRGRGCVLIVVDRRWAGLVLLIVVALAAVTLPHLGGRRVGGSAVVTVVPGAPQVGSCVTALSPAPSIQLDDAPDQTSITYPYAVYGSCDGVVAGEVMSLSNANRSPVGTTVGSYLRAGAACQLDEVNYVGSIGPFDPVTIAKPGIAWQAAAFVDSVLVGPDSLQRAAGQTWTACIGATPDRVPYRGRIANALTTGVLPPTFAICWKALPVSTDPQVDDQLTSCTTPHPVEVLATTQIIDDTTTTAQVDASCLGFASRAMRTADPTRGGVVRISAYSVGADSVRPLTTPALMVGYIECIASVAAPQALVGTLIGLGDRPAPITG
jgi:hypothetical protein